MRPDDECCTCGDAEWGRAAGRRPPLRWWAPLVAVGCFAVILTLMVVFVVRGPGPEDDPDPAAQRDGLLLDGAVIPLAVDGIEFGGRTVVVLFDREVPSGAVFERWSREVSDDGVDLDVVVAGSADAAAIASTLRLPTPVDGDFPVGYAVVDSDRVLRYSTLDPEYLDNAFEVDVITGAVQ